MAGPSKIKGSLQTAVVLLPKQKFVDWANWIDEGKVFTLATIDPAVYLFPEHSLPHEIESALPVLFDRIFYTELRDYTNEEELFPKNRTFEMFNEWFDVKCILNVYKVKKEELSGLGISE